MPKFQVQVPHTLTTTEASERLHRFVETLRTKMADQVSDLEERWEGNQLHFGFKTYGIPIKGTMTMTDQVVGVNGDLPFSAMLFKGKIESSIREQLERLLE